MGMHFSGGGTAHSEKAEKNCAAAAAAAAASFLSLIKLERIFSGMKV